VALRLTATCGTPGVDVEVVAGVGHLTMLELVACPQLDLLSADHVKGGFVLLVGVGFGASSGP
jgi:hypothetical protein